jgi:hypothetical protein
VEQLPSDVPEEHGSASFDFLGGAALQRWIATGTPSGFSR